MFVTLKERLKVAKNEKQKKIIIKDICDEILICDSDVSFVDVSYNDLLSPLCGHDVQSIGFEVDDKLLFDRFVCFLNEKRVSGDAYFYISKEDSYHVIKVNISYFISNPDFFWRLKGGNNGKSDCILVSVNGTFGFCKLYTEYNYELVEWG